MIFAVVCSSEASQEVQPHSREEHTTARTPAGADHLEAALEYCELFF